MKNLQPTVRGLVGVLGASLLSTACIITGLGDDVDTGVGSDDSTVPAETGLPSDSTGGADSDGTTGGPAGDCTENLLLDPGFEGGTPSAAWTEASTLFGTPICDASCVLEGDPPEPYAGDWWVWIGGASEMDLMEGPEAASVSQMVTVEPDSAYLSFWFQIRSSAGTGNDIFTVTLDGDTVFMATDAEIDDYATYTRIELDVTPWADGGTYELVFSGEQIGPDKTSFYVDEVSLITCAEEPAATDSGTTGDTEGQDTTAGTGADSGSTGATDGTGTDGSSGGSGGSGGSSSTGA